MHLLHFPTEIRLRIYPELLVRDNNSPVEFGADHGPRNPRLLTRTRGLHPAILRVSKQIHAEAAPLLYSDNRFRFPDAYTDVDQNDDTWCSTDVPYIAPFLAQIGPGNAGLLRHICINFPSFLSDGSWRNRSLALSKGWVQVLQLIQAACPGLKTVEISNKPPDGEFTIQDVDVAAEMLLLLHEGGFKDMGSLERIVVVHGVYHLNEKATAARDVLMAMMPSGKWSIELTKAPPRVWISSDDRVEFDNEEDCRLYDNEVFRREMQMEEELERELWEEEYYRRRRDPYWKNDSDYD